MEKVFFKKEKSGNIRCLACRHNCIIPENRFGLCGARKNIEGKIILLTHSKPCSLHIDPIEKKPLFHYLPGSTVASIGFFGCNFRCDFCQNYDISCMRGKLLEEQVKKIETVSPKEFISFAKKSSAKSIAITYNEPAISVEYNIDAIKLAKKQKPKLGTVYVSNGYASEEQITELKKSKTRLDATNIDLKSFNADFYRKICGAELEKVLKCIKDFYKTGTWIELTTLLIPGKNDSGEELEQIADFIHSIDKNIPWHVSAFFPTHRMNNVRPASSEEIMRAVRIGKETGLNFVYGGNIRAGNENTYCPKCNTLLIKRDGFNAQVLELNKGKCIRCGEKIKGIFD
ncbi:MAG: AmmeMemoRadiSam system radical SAM enzyme [archaeon]